MTSTVVTHILCDSVTGDGLRYLHSTNMGHLVTGRRGKLHNPCNLVLLSKVLVDEGRVFTGSTLWAELVIESQCPSIYIYIY